jgi:hypothetical protein
MDIWNILWTCGIFYGHLVHFVLIWYIFSGFGIMYQEESGNPAVRRDVAANRGGEKWFGMVLRARE